MSDLFHDLIHHTAENIFGGEDLFDSSGQQVGHTAPNIHGGQDLFDAHGAQTGHTSDNIFGGEDLHVDGHVVLSSHPGIGGEHFVDSGGQEVGHATHWGDSVTLHDAAGQHATWYQNLCGGRTLDVLSDMANVVFPSLL